LLLLTPPTCAAAAAAADTFTVELEHEEIRTAAKVVPRADGTVALTGLDGNVEYVSGARIRAIRDSSGEDRTSDVLIGRETLPAGRKHKPPKPIKYHSLRFRPGPGTECGSYLITESVLMWGNGGYSLIEYGFARNIGKSHSIGVTGFAGFKEYITQTGFRLRFVQWVDRRVSVNFSPGLVLAGNGVYGTTSLVTPQFAGQVGINLNGRVGLAAEVFRSHTHDDSGYEPDVRNTNIQMGFRFGAEPGLPGTLVALLMAIVLQYKD